MKVSIMRNTSTVEDRRYWKFVDQTAQEVASWPNWMKGLSARQTAVKSIAKSKNAVKTTSSTKGNPG
jgi:hypothetical protein